MACQAIKPWRICSIPSLVCPCCTSAQPCGIELSGPQYGNPCSVARLMAASARSWAARPSRQN
jgi:hypothetical protein